MAKKPGKVKLTELLRDMLGERATKELLEVVDPDFLKELKKGKSIPTVADLLVKKIVRYALDPSKAYQWAVEMIWNYNEGKPAMGSPVTDDGREFDEQMDDLTREHLNSMAAQFSKSAAEQLLTEAAEPSGKDDGGGPANRLLSIKNGRSVDADSDTDAPDGEHGDPA